MLTDRVTGYRWRKAVVPKTNPMTVFASKVGGNIAEEETTLERGTIRWNSASKF